MNSNYVFCRILWHSIDFSVNELPIFHAHRFGANRMTDLPSLGTDRAGRTFDSNLRKSFRTEKNRLFTSIDIKYRDEFVDGLLTLNCKKKKRVYVYEIMKYTSRVEVKEGERKSSRRVELKRAVESRSCRYAFSPEREPFPGSIPMVARSTPCATVFRHLYFSTKSFSTRRLCHQCWCDYID